MSEENSEAYRKARNTAMDVFVRHFPHVPILVDDDPAMPAGSADLRRKVVSAITDALIEQLKRIGQEVSDQQFSVNIGTVDRRSSVNFPVGRDVAAFILEDLHLFQKAEEGAKG